MEVFYNMNTRKKKIVFTVLALALTIGLTACSGGANNNEPSSSPSASPTASQSASASPSASASEQPTAELPATKSFTLELEGNKEEREATLAVGDGYSLYMFEQFSFDQASDKLTMNVDPNYYVEITKLPVDYNGDVLKQEGTAELQAIGTVEDMTSKDSGSIIKNATVYLKARDDKGSKEYIVTEFGGNGYILKVNIPVGEPTEGFVPLAHTSITSIVNQ
jgi:hypothetical protein